MTTQDHIDDARGIVEQMYRDDQGNPIILSDGQAYIFSSIFKRLTPRLHIMCHTRYGKSMTVALAVLTRAARYPEKWAILAGEKEKAKIIMDHVISHIFDNSFTKERFLPDKGESWEDIRRYKNKNHLTFKVGEMPDGKALLSEIFIGSAKDALGFGAPNVVEDEAALIPNADHSFVVRMLGDNPHENFLVKIGNPFTREHFLDSYRDPAFKKIVVDCYRSIGEKRITEETINENKKYAFFDVLFECKFPSATAIDEQGWQHLLTEGDIITAEQRIVEPFGLPRLGVDVAKGGRNFNCWVLRQDNCARVLLKNHEEDSVRIADQTVAFMQEHGITPKATFIDDTGVGHGVVSILRNRSLKVEAVNFGEAADESGERESVAKGYKNLRAICYAGERGVQQWIKGGARLEPNEEWMELTKIPYKKDLGGRTQIMPKDEMRKRGIESPDVADALALTFAKPKIMVYSQTNKPFVSPVPTGYSAESDRPYKPWGGVEWGTEETV